MLIFPYFFSTPNNKSNNLYVQMAANEINIKHKAEEDKKKEDEKTKEKNKANAEKAAADYKISIQNGLKNLKKLSGILYEKSAHIPGYEKSLVIEKRTHNNFFPVIHSVHTVKPVQLV